jgi:hypothetical protein
MLPAAADARGRATAHGGKVDGLVDGLEHGFRRLLVLVIGGLVWVAWRQLQDARVLQRAYIGALPGGISTTTRGELLAHVEFKNVGHLPASQVKSPLKFTASDDGDWLRRVLMTRICAPLAFCRSASASRAVVTRLEYPKPGRNICMRGDGSLMWMASVRSGGRIFAIATTPKSENPKPVGAISFAKKTARHHEYGNDAN